MPIYVMEFLTKFGYKKICSNINKITIVAIATVFYSFEPNIANAGIFSAITDLAGDKVSARTIEVSSSSSQDLFLLEAPINSDPNPYKGDKQPILAFGNALSAEIGPQGTVSDIESRVSNEISIYTVRKGDSISSIAEMFDVSINTIIWANELSRNTTLTEGQTLVILPISGIRYTVKKGDTIKGIVFRYKADLDEVLQYNDITLSSPLVAGTTIVIPDAEPSVVEVPKAIKTKTPTNKAHDTNGPFYPGYFIRPIAGGYKSQGLHGYNGVDLAAPVGTPIRASAGGKVISSISNGSWNGGYGNYVIIAHDNGTKTLYAHTQKNFVKVGDVVEQGEMIAKIGMTGKTTGPHVHFEIRGAKNPF